MRQLLPQVRGGETIGLIYYPKMYNNSFLSINYQLLFTDLIALILSVSEGFLSL